MERISLFLYCPSIAALTFTIALTALTLHNYSRTGPGIQKEIEKNFLSYAIFALSRLAFWLIVILYTFSIPGPITVFSLSKVTNLIKFDFSTCLLSCFLSTSIISAYFFLYQLLFTPGSIQLSFQYRFSRLFNLWKTLSPNKISFIKYLLNIWLISALASAYFFAAIENDTALTYYLSAISFFYLSVYVSLNTKEPLPANAKNQEKPNVIMIGSDTLRYDRVDERCYHRKLTPNINKLCKHGLLLNNCITPLARTAPSVASLFTGLWPHHHRIRDNYPYEADCRLPQPSLVEILNSQGYQTSVISDWSGADFAKLSFNFTEKSLPEDQWNIKLLLRQGPSLIRSFISLFTNNPLGKRFLPELYYLAGVPLTRQLGLECRQLIARSAKKEQPFFINLFTSATHVPFNSEYPYYNLYTPKDYKGESRFIMTRLASAEEIINKQERGAESFDVPQIINLYDSCVKQFDDEVGKIVEYIEKSGLTDNTIIIVYSDHGADFFETGSWGQGNTLIGNDPSGRIPLVLKGPGIPKDMNFPYVSRTIDIMPTLLNLLDIPIPSTLDGVNLMPFINTKTSPELFAFQETGIWLGKIPGLHPEQILYPNITELLDIPNRKTGTLVVNEKYYPTVIRAKSRSIQNEKWKLIYLSTHSGPVYQLYDLENDPYQNVLDQHIDIFNLLKNTLEKHISQDTALQQI